MISKKAIDNFDYRNYSYNHRLASETTKEGRVLDECFSGHSGGAVGILGRLEHRPACDAVADQLEG